jgi:PIN domain nuclease of toxin-antitoxin system
MHRAVLDASALLAYLGNEPGAETVENFIGDGVCLSTVNWAEVLSKLNDRGQSVQLVVKELTASALIGGAIELLPFTAEDSQIVAQLRDKTKSTGLSLADRACMALALRLKLPIVTADRVWMQVKLGTTVKCIR